jgi:hypothetical protein
MSAACRHVRFSPNSKLAASTKKVPIRLQFADAARITHPQPAAFNRFLYNLVVDQRRSAAMANGYQGSARRITTIGSGPQDRS